MVPSPLISIKHGQNSKPFSLPLDQKFYIAATFLSVEFFSQLLVERGEPYELLMKENLKYAEEQLGPGLTEANVDSFLRKIVDFHDSQKKSTA